MPKNVILISTGSHNPPHPGHVNMLLLAKNHLESFGYTVTQVYASPSHDQYVSFKYYDPIKLEEKIFERPRLNGKTRRKLWKALIRERHPELALHKFESKIANGFVEHTDVVNYLQQQVDKDTLVVYVAGEDLARSCLSMWAKKPFPFNVICVARSATRDAELEKRLEAFRTSRNADITCYIDNPLPSVEMSSTGIMAAKEEQLAQLPFSYLNTLLQAMETQPEFREAFSRKLLFSVPKSSTMSAEEKEKIQTALSGNHRLK